MASAIARNRRWVSGTTFRQASPYRAEIGFTNPKPFRHTHPSPFAYPSHTRHRNQQLPFTNTKFCRYLPPLRQRISPLLCVCDASFLRSKERRKLMASRMMQELRSEMSDRPMELTEYEASGIEKLGGG